MSKTMSKQISDLYSLFKGGVLSQDVVNAAFEKMMPSSELRTIFSLLISGVLTIDAANYAITKIDSTIVTASDVPRTGSTDESVCSTTSNGGMRIETWTCGDNIKHKLTGPALIVLNKDGSKTETWFENNKMHRLDGPAYIVYNKDGKIVEERWYENNSDKLFRDGLMRNIYNEDGSIMRKVIKRNFDGGYTETWTHNDVIHNVSGYVAITVYNAEGNKIRAISYIKGKKCGTDIEYYCNGKKKHETFFMDDKPYARGGHPTHVTYYESGARKREIWHNLDGQMHRVAGPALVMYHRNGSKKLEIYYVNGIEHCSTGPADICYKENGKISRETYVVSGSQFKGLSIRR
jgi:antitoxin component YwqK of YwqJK toxin-antitoxin module